MIITTVQRPQLTEQEQAKRMEVIKQAATRLMLATYKQQEVNRRNTNK